MSYLELRKVSKSYGEGATQVRALRDIDLTVERGSLVAVMGPSGSGKSTLLTIAGSLEEPTSGDVLIDGAALTAMSRNDRARMRRRTIGYVFQEFNLLAGLTAAENVSLPLELDGLSAKKARLTGTAALEELGLGDRAGHYPDELSGGERQRVAIARALATEPRFIVCDEPVSALDASVQAAIVNLLADLRDRFGLAYLFISHDLAVVAQLSDRIAVMYRGRICEIGTPAELLAVPHHPYTRMLLAAVTDEAPDEDTASLESIEPTGSGCAFADRCPHCRPSVCITSAPSLRPVSASHEVACHLDTVPVPHLDGVLLRSIAP
jgi:putative ABC transport system ATP-binding protein